jgi:hypothetical protein
VNNSTINNELIKFHTAVHCAAEKQSHEEFPKLLFEAGRCIQISFQGLAASDNKVLPSYHYFSTILSSTWQTP